MTQIKCFIALLLIAARVNAQTETTANNTISCFTTQPVTLSRLTFTLYDKQNQKNGTVLTAQTLHQVNASLRVIFIIHGWLQNAIRPWALLMKDTYLDKAEANVIMLDWSYYSGINYPRAYCSVPQVGAFTGDLIYNLTVTVDVSLTTVQLNGFSLGAHVSGYAGQRIQTLTGANIERINGLDAAFQGYLGVPTDERLDASDANFVQGIHTSNYQFGYPLPYATIDFQVNRVLAGCGAEQNGCPRNPGIADDGSPLPYIFCNHVRAISYFIESINSDNFIGVNCSTCVNFGLGLCTSRCPTTIMGENCPSTASGVSYLNTSSQSPFALGSAGIQ